MALLETSAPCGLSLSAAWSRLSAGLVPLSALGLEASGMGSGSDFVEDDLHVALETLRQHGLQSVAMEWFMEVLQVDLQKNIAAEFWDFLTQRENMVTEQQRSKLLYDAFCMLDQRLAPYLCSLKYLETWIEAGLITSVGPGTLRDKVYTMVKAVLFFSTVQPFQEIIHEFYTRAFSIYVHQDKTLRNGDGMSEEEDENAVDDIELLNCAGCNAVKEQCWCTTAVEQFAKVNHVLHSLNLLERISASAITTILHKMIEEHVGRLCRGEYENSFLSQLEEWLESKVICWLSMVFLQKTSTKLSSPQTSSTLQRWRIHLQFFLYQVYANMRIEELFSIIRDFPESKAALQDLKVCLERTNQRQQLLSSLKAALETRLLHPGVNTADVITLYISAIKALRELDPSMVILEVVCEPVRKYLRTRDDTVRQIVAGLTDDSEGSSDLANELSKADPITLEHGHDSDDDMSDPDDWVPDPVDADPGKFGSKRRSSDIITLLVSIYGSKELFINEYRTLLADRILHHFSYVTCREIRNLELLKLRFGEAQMHFCEVMLKDVADSRRINSHIHEEDQETPLHLNAMILSGEFWPPLKEEKLELPTEVKEAMDAYTKKYEKLKAMRSLNWKPHLGNVDLEIELADRTLSVSVSPVHAAIIMHFQQKSTWTLDELSDALKVPVVALRRKIALWQQQGVLKEDPTDTFTVIEEEQKDQQEKMVLIDSDEEGDSAMASQADQKEEELQLFWTYIQGMLTNLESLPLERIHTMLKMFVMTGPVMAEIDMQELQAFLQKKVKDHQLVYSGGVYRLPKSNC
ncbi:anaphase-promoting complex subunit 2 isoform X1 [Hemiscyllium ocellatum]|uniref:anaphase-promoting complex subunit 2 isoform X1 n=1 Tax=Hemiscyllium ocellatum TaxID=170820 RepID=UPI0029675198|nr:anaphase-promoting complex subunit 2 isoform X1 [Hemiscyllium ocellatum]XP_060697248.1 anaphase-promoting complex subunit 2 isoform X1 [Hemiscyllium ocellatum]